VSIQRPTIGNQGATIRSFTTQNPPVYEAQQPGPYPGLSDGGGYYSPAPFTPPPDSDGIMGKLSSLFSGGGGSSAGGSSFNIAQIKQVVDRLGGIEGIMETMGKVQKMVQSFQQVAPLVKVLMGSFIKGKKKRRSDDFDGPLRRKRRKKTTAVNKGKGRRKRRVPQLKVASAINRASVTDDL
jgi:hypothetical protein